MEYGIFQALMQQTIMQSKRKPGPKPKPKPYAKGSVRSMEIVSDQIDYSSIRGVEPVSVRSNTVAELSIAININGLATLEHINTAARKAVKEYFDDLIIERERNKHMQTFKNGKNKSKKA